MRKLFLISILLISVVCVNATIWRVAQDDSYLPHFKTVQTAIDGANAGDTIYVYPGTYEENVSVKKTLTLLGAGYWLNESRTDSVSRFLSGTSLYSIKFEKGSDYSTIAGFYFYANSSGFNCDSTSNLTITNINSRVRVSITNSRNIFIKKSFLEGIGRHYYGYDADDNSIAIFNTKNVDIETSILLRDCTFDDKSEIYLKNNYFGRNFSITNSTLENNILMGGSYNFTNCWISNCIFNTGCTLNNPPLTNCINATFAEVYPNSIQTDHYQLPVNSVAKGKGLNGVDCGPFGGNDPYQISGIGMIPSVLVFNVRQHANNDEGLKMKIKIKANK